MEVGKTTITVGTGMVFMMLPDVKSMVTEGPNNAADRFPGPPDIQILRAFQ